jgi:hypothetical protein
MAVWLTLNYAVQPVSYTLHGDVLFIKRRWVGALRIPLRDILGVSPAAALADVPRKGLRQSFNAGVFGYNGPFQLEQYGKVFFTATDRERLVAVARRNQLTLIVSPARPRDFIETIREEIIRVAEAELETPKPDANIADTPSTRV